MAWGAQLYTEKWKNMAFRNFKIQVILRSILIGLALFAFVFSIYQEKWYVTSGTLLVVAALLVADLIRYVEKTRRDISSFLVSVNLRDFTSIAEIERKSDKKNQDLTEAFKFIANEFQHVRIEKEMHYQYLQTVIGHVETALICFDAKGKVALINDSAKKLLDTQSAQSLEFLRRSKAEIGQMMSSIRSGEQKLIKSRLRGELMQLSVRATEFKLRDQHYKLVALQDIKNELENKELESWQRLIKILRHEIMNSVTPISSLSQAIKQNLEDEAGRTLNLKDISDEELKDIYESVITIENRSKGLLQFVETYRNLTKLNKPNFEKTKLSDLLNHINSLMKHELARDDIRLGITNSSGEADLYIDHDMIVRVLINLISNARDALSGVEHALISIDCFRDEKNRLNILVRDNGPGMEPETLDNVFIPFFTTKENGSGIGLSLCRQIMHLHKGSITAESEAGKGTTISLKF